MKLQLVIWGIWAKDSFQSDNQISMQLNLRTIRNIYPFNTKIKPAHPAHFSRLY